MAFTPESLKRQNELLQALRGELAAKERELADQKWVFEQFLKSPSWRLTYPIRWTAGRVRLMRKAIAKWLGTEAPLAAPAVDDSMAIEHDLVPGELKSDVDMKAVITSLHRVSLESLLVSTLDLPASPLPTVSVIAVLFNRAELTLACLRSIVENCGIESEVVIVDNGSSDKTGLLLDRVRGARIIRNKENLNFLLAVNQAARESRGEYLLLLNNDAQLMPGAVTNALQTIRSSPDIGAVGGKIVLLDGTLQEAGSIVWRDGSCLGYGRGDNPSAPMYMFRRDVDYCSAAFLLTPRRVWEQLGGFDEIFRPAYYEETDYCMRLKLQGLRTVYEPEAIVQHYEFASSESTGDATHLQREHQRIFAARHRAALEKHEAPNINRAVHARSKHSGQTILYIDDQVPHVWLGSGFPRAQALIRALLKQGCLVTLYPLTVVDEEWDKIYSDLPREVEVMAGFGRKMLEAFLRNRRDYYTAIVVSRPHNMNILQEVLSAHPEWVQNTQVIYDAEALFASREIGLRKLTGNPMSDEEIRETIQKEVGLISAADRVVAVSQRERDTFLKYGNKAVHILGHSIQVAPTTTPFEQRTGLLFVGAVHEDMSPNADSLVWFLTEILPRIQAKLGEVSLTIAGINRSERIRELAGPSVRITGHLPDLSELYASARLFVAPSRYAAGIPHKVHEAAARGLPIVATPLLAEQLGWTDRELAIAGTAETFAQRCNELYTEPAHWSELREAALQRVRVECSEETFEESVRGLLTAGEPEDGLKRLVQVRG